MKIVKPGYTILTEINGMEILKKIEAAGRTCYKSEDKITDNSAYAFVKMIMGKGHASVVEHESISVRFVFDRGISHEMVRHRLSSFSQESTRYCNYSKDKYNNEINVIDIEPHLKSKEALDIWIEAIKTIEEYYFKLIELGETAQIARSLLPNSLKTEIVVTANLRQWNEIFTQRAAKTAHPQIREVMKPLLNDLKLMVPGIFDITCEKLVQEDFSGFKTRGSKIHFSHMPKFYWDNAKKEVVASENKNAELIDTTMFPVNERKDFQDLLDKYKKHHIVFYIEGHTIYHPGNMLRYFVVPFTEEEKND